MLGADVLQAIMDFECGADGPDCVIAMREGCPEDSCAIRSQSAGDFGVIRPPNPV